MGYELPILGPNVDHKFLGWRPWHVRGDRKIQKRVCVSGGEPKSGATISGWTAEVYVPYKLLEPLANVPPKPDRMASELLSCRLRQRQDDGMGLDPCGTELSRIEKFGTLVFD